MESTERFSDRVEDYVRYRPRYPRAALDVLREELGLEPGWVVADVGSGPGLSAELFLEHGNTVMAVEPNGAMRAAAEARLGNRPAFHSVAGTAERTTLPAHSVDLVLAAQAFHWFRTDEARREFRRILRRPGRVALLWNRRRVDASPFLRAYEDLLLRFGTDYQRVRHDRLDGATLRDFLGPRYRRRVLPNEQVLDLDGLQGRLLSSSYTPAAGDPERPPMLAALARLFHTYERDGHVRLEYDTEIHTGDLA